MDFAIWNSRESFLREINRGGLCVSTDVLFIAALHVQEYLTRIFQNEDLKKQLSSFKDARAVFVRCLLDTIAKGENMESICKVTCASGHQFSKNISLGQSSIWVLRTILLK